MLPKRWIFAPTAPHGMLERYTGMSPALAHILYNRGFTDPDSARNFLTADKIDDNPFSMKGMSQAVERLRRAIKRKEQVIVYGDFDADGVTSTVLLVQVLQELGAVVKPYIPHRVDEGYGLNSDALQRLARAGAKVVITVDCGIRSVDEVEDGKAAGLDMIVTDHHSIGPSIPKALAVLNPKQEDCKYPEDMLAGVGVAYKLADALIRAAKQDKQFTSFTADELLDLVAIGTVADLAPLDRLENRAFVRYGLDVLNQARRPGIRALMAVAGIEKGKITSESIGFGLGPRINAAGRLEDAMIAYHLLAAADDETAEPLAEKLQQLNLERQDLTRKAQDLIRDRLDEPEKLPLIFAGDSSFKPGIVGLVAGRLAEEYYRPAVVLEEGEVESRASCRSIPQFDITQALDQCADLLVRHGGHAQAAGFTVRNENIPALKHRLTELAYEYLSGQELRPVLEIDADVELSELSEKLLEELGQLQPTGHGNDAPILATRNVRLYEAPRTVGRDGHHLKLRIARAGQTPLDAIGFGLGDLVGQLGNSGDRVDAAFQLEMNEWNGNRNLQLHLLDVKKAGTER